MYDKVLKKRNSLKCYKINKKKGKEEFKNLKSEMKIKNLILQYLFNLNFILEKFYLISSRDNKFTDPKKTKIKNYS